MNSLLAFFQQILALAKYFHNRTEFDVRPFDSFRVVDHPHTHNLAKNNAIACNSQYWIFSPIYVNRKKIDIEFYNRKFRNKNTYLLAIINIYVEES